MSLIIHRCLKKPGIIDRARMFYLEFNEKGLYVIATGKGTQVPTVRGPFAEVIAEKAVNFFIDRYEPEIVANEERIRIGQIETMATEKHSFFLSKNEIELFKSSPDIDSIKISIKGNKNSIKLYAHPGYQNVIEAMERSIDKK